jgi:hypothetical protein
MLSGISHLNLLSYAAEPYFPYDTGFVIKVKLLIAYDNPKDLGRIFVRRYLNWPPDSSNSWSTCGCTPGEQSLGLQKTFFARMMASILLTGLILEVSERC